ncbi:hypothetical protein MSP8886_02703 [Marinomonas spartinae]|uniref:Uncharacterized protein n=1 Tax=Marinomonas spartinae TaxID=1792290 RepID=A0A1A8TKP5_9GAMM|nr:hypothetical protein [Marinomonas spartinae]SBS33281.1 hypothetical protein MSP8886_02703 [Marinomonas spartinae]
MPNALPKIAFTKLTSPPPLGSIQFYKGYFPSLLPGEHHINLTQNLQNYPGDDTPSYTAPQQTFEVKAPQFRIDPNIISSIYPPKASQGKYEQVLPFVVLHDAALPWERSLVPGDPPPQDGGTTTPWMALLLLAEDEVIMPEGASSPITATTVTELLTADPHNLVFKPQLSTSGLSQDELNASCQTICIPGELFASVLPSVADLTYLAHCCCSHTADADGSLHSTVLANRLPVTPPGKSQRYFAHLVSLEGFADYLGPSATTAIPTQPHSQQLMQVQLISLYNWSFTCLAEENISFKQLLTGLIASEQTTGTGSLTLPTPTAGTPDSVTNRLAEGYAPLTFMAGDGEQSFAWYRGPLCAMPAPTLPAVGQQQLAILQAPRADALMIYLQQQGIFDLSYAAAWNIGRNLALTDADFAQKLNQLQRTTHSKVSLLAQRLSTPHLAGLSYQEMLHPQAMQRQFTRAMANGLGATMSAALRHRGPAASAATTQTATVHPKDVLNMPQAMTAIGNDVSESLTTVALWLAKLIRLTPVPFSHLVPDARMLPAESIRFFYLDPNWIDALTAGALSIGIQCAADRSIQSSLLPTLMAEVQQQLLALRTRVYPNAAPSSGKICGLLIRSQLVSAWPNLVITASQNSLPVNLIRNECLAPNVRLCLFEDIPDTVNLAEPYHGLQFGIEDSGIAARNLTTTGSIGALIPGQDVTPSYRSVTQGQLGGVLDVASIVTALATATQVTPTSQFNAGDFALQMVKTPEIQPFPSAS